MSKPTAESAVYVIESDGWIATFEEQQGPFGALTPLRGQFFIYRLSSVMTDGASGLRRRLFGRCRSNRPAPEPKVFDMPGQSDLQPEIKNLTLPAVVFWWIRTVLLALLSLFFLLYGIETVIGAYSLKNPMEFMMYFFSASFLILLSGVGLTLAFFKIQGRLRARRTKSETGGCTGR
jgi:hypothetical protein